ncbi:hypothetical protein B0H10DRAFT_1949995 [Mycena sp. CBHHK59/15]|nr:hypothetical protein B0H10DRAFT_1949995 [Mycena sp. CBHHK59/15]
MNDAAVVREKVDMVATQVQVNKTPAAPAQGKGGGAPSQAIETPGGKHHIHRCNAHIKYFDDLFHLKLLLEVYTMNIVAKESGWLRIDHFANPLQRVWTAWEHAVPSRSPHCQLLLANSSAVHRKFLVNLFCDCLDTFKPHSCKAIGKNYCFASFSGKILIFAPV